MKPEKLKEAIEYLEVAKSLLQEFAADQPQYESFTPGSFINGGSMENAELHLVGGVLEVIDSCKRFEAVTKILVRHQGWRFQNSGISP